ncbi:ribosomal protein S3 [Homo sapiens]|uniref:Ribosomal protein S3 n=1 Tax=Homo sapiens TaxID=9606 RepID=E9PJH4_HUMAN|nr:ribosomal protein S3 [Homo sapiens]KAI4073202.1 ribosomal protein S3 [Homo sapiens]
MAVQISKKRKFVADGIFKAELNEFLTRELAEDGYSGVEVRVTPTRTEIIILATRTQNVLGEKGRRIRELTAVVQKRFGFPEGSVEGLLWCAAVHHGEWGQRLRGCGVWETPRTEG